MRVSAVTLAMCRHLAALGLGTYATGGTYAESDTAITIKRLPSAPARAIAVTVYDVDDAAPGLANEQYAVQLRFRAPGPPSSVDDLADAVAEALHNRHGFDMGGVHVARAVRVNIAPMGADDNGREERADNYRLIIQRP